MSLLGLAFEQVPVAILVEKGPKLAGTAQLVVYSQTRMRRESHSGLIAAYTTHLTVGMRAASRENQLQPEAATEAG